MNRWRRASLHATALALLACVGFVLCAEAFEHTDDGCAVETHCLPCRWQHGATVVFASVPQPCAPIDLGSAYAFSKPRPRLAGAMLETPSRAPPSA